MEQQREREPVGGNDSPAGEDVRVNIPRAEQSDMLSKYGETARERAALSVSQREGQ